MREGVLEVVEGCGEELIIHGGWLWSAGRLVCGEGEKKVSLQPVCGLHIIALPVIKW